MTEIQGKNQKYAFLENYYILFIFKGVWKQRKMLFTHVYDAIVDLEKLS